MENKKFFINTRANWIYAKCPKRDPDYISTTGSKYWYTPEGVYRYSNHWSHIYTNRYRIGGCIRISTCYWVLKLNFDINYVDIRLFGICGFCRWDKFKDNLR